MGKKKAKAKNSIPGKPLEQKQAIAGGKFSLSSFKVQALFLAIIGLVCFANSFSNDYALDDSVVILKNEYVQAGAAGIPDILSNDAFASFYKQMGSDQELAGGRYRPLSIVTFAMEQEFFGPKEGEVPQNDLSKIRHITNVFLYILSVIVLLYFLRNFIFKENTLIAFIASALFLIHPIHTEVVANIKSRDEIMSFLFILLTFITVLRYDETKKKKFQVLALIVYFLALLSKEYAITLLALIPMLLYIVKGDTIKSSLVKTIPFFAVAIGYVLIRLSIIGVGATAENNEVLNNPFLYATSPEKWATKIELLDHYLRLLFYPDPLSSDYSYNTIPYINFANGWVWVSILIHVSLIAAALKLFFKRNILSFAIAFYLLNLFMISNLVFDIGATMGERLIYHSSLGFVLAIAIGIVWLLKKINNTVALQITGVAIGCVLLTWCAVKDIDRDKDWLNNVSLFLADVKKVPNSVLANGNAGKDYVDLALMPENKDRSKELMDSGVGYLNKAVSIHKGFVNGYLDLAFAYVKQQQYDSAGKNIMAARALYPNNPYVDSLSRDVAAGYTNQAVAVLNTDVKSALVLMEKAATVAPNNIDALNNLGTAYFIYSKDYVKARQQWNKVLNIDPSNKKAIANLALLPK